MSNIDINSPYLEPDDVGVDNNRLIVTTRPTDFGTFAVTTPSWSDNNQKYGVIPFAKAKSFRINNYTGKLIGIRRRHKTILVDNFEDAEFPDWTGSVTVAPSDIEGFSSGKIKDQAYRPLTTEKMLDESEVEVKFRTADTLNFSVNISVWDNASRIGAGSSAASYSGDQTTLSPNQLYKVIFRLRPTEGKSDTFLEYVDGEREIISTNVGGEFGTNEMKDSVISIEGSEAIVVDPIMYHQKVNYSHEQIISPSSSVYPCLDNISEYEVINLGSDALNYSDTNVNVTLSGFHAV